ncbi:IclR family transcriptional regulator [Cereibacter sphaeroides]|nr:IclR family transcriptional regulator [Cereibacter sphaeroides]
MSEAASGSQSIDRALALLSLVAGQGGTEVPMPVLTKETGLSRPTIRRIMLALIRAGYVEQAPGGGYFPGPECLVLGAMASRRHNLLDLSMDGVIALAAESGDSAFVSVRSGSHSVCLHREEGDFPIRTHVLQPGARHPLGVGAGAMAMLAALPDEDVDFVLAQTREEIERKYPLFDDAFLRTELAATRERGWTVNPGMYVANSWAIGLPILGPGGTVLGSLSIAAIDSRMTPERQPELARMLRREVARIETRLQAPARPAAKAPGA